MARHGYRIDPAESPIMWRIADEPERLGITVMFSISPMQSDLQQAVGAFLMNITGLAAGQIVAAQPNRVAEPKPGTFIVMTVVRFNRLRTNVDMFEDVKFIGTAAGNALTVSEVDIGVIEEGAILFGTSIPAGTAVTGQTSGTAGGPGVYTVNSTLEIPSPETISAGVRTVEMASEITVQLDFHSDDYSSTAMAQLVAATLRDPYGVEFFAGLAAPMNAIGPLLADDPEMRPFTNAEQNYEWRWVSEAKFQINQTVVIPQQFFDFPIDIDVISVEAAYPVEQYP